VIWTREYVVAAIKETPDKDAAAGRLLRNQEDIGNAVAPLYGDDAGKGLTDLPRTRSGARTSTRSPPSSVGRIPNWPKNDLLDLLNLHLTLTKGEVVARLQQDLEKDVEAFDDIFTEILTVADALSDGIVKQFPERYGDDAR
jgi:hypothetical protein